MVAMVTVYKGGCFRGFSIFHWHHFHSS